MRKWVTEGCVGGTSSGGTICVRMDGGCASGAGRVDMNGWMVAE
jgi:hypothetical protein